MSGRCGADGANGEPRTGSRVYDAPSLWETDTSEALRAGFALKSWLGCCQPNVQKSGSWLVAAFLNPSCITTFLLQLSTYRLVHSMFHGSNSKAKKPDWSRSGYMTCLGFIYLESRLYPSPSCMWGYMIQNAEAEYV